MARPRTAVVRSAGSMNVFMLTSAFVPRLLVPLPVVVRLPLLAGIVARSSPAVAASFPPSYHFQSLRTERVTVHFHQGLEDMARQAAALADDILARYEK